MKKPIEVLTKELNKLGGECFARWLAGQNPEVKKTVEASEFMEDMLNGKITKDNKEYLDRYLKPMHEIIKAISILSQTN